MFKVQKCLTSGPENKFCLLTSFGCNPHRAFKIVRSLSVVLNWDIPHKNRNPWLFSSILATQQQEQSDSFLFSSRSQWDRHIFTCAVTRGLNSQFLPCAHPLRLWGAWRVYRGRGEPRAWSVTREKGLRGRTRPWEAGSAHSPPAWVPTGTVLGPAGWAQGSAAWEH